MKPPGGYLAPLRGFLILEIKVIGPITEQRYRGCAFAKTSPEPQKVFNLFLEKIKRDGAYLKLVRRYYPKVFSYCREFFEENNGGHFREIEEDRGPRAGAGKSGRGYSSPGAGIVPR